MDVFYLFASPATPGTGFPPLPALLERRGWCTEADPMAADGSTSPQVQCLACNGETEIPEKRGQLAEKEIQEEIH